MKEAIIANYSIQESVANLLEQCSHRVTLPANSLLLTAGDLNDKLYFIERGLVRAFYEHNSSEYISWFVSEGEFMYSVDGFLKGDLSRENIQLIEASTIRYISYSDLQALLITYPAIAGFIQRLTEQDLLFYENRLRTLRGAKPKERLRLFEQKYSTVYHRLPLKYIASYLDMTPSTLSRVRSELIKEQRQINVNT